MPGHNVQHSQKDKVIVVSAEAFVPCEATLTDLAVDRAARLVKAHRMRSDKEQILLSRTVFEIHRLELFFRR